MTNLEIVTRALSAKTAAERANLTSRLDLTIINEDLARSLSYAGAVEDEILVSLLSFLKTEIEQESEMHLYILKIKKAMITIVNMHEDEFAEMMAPATSIAEAREIIETALDILATR